MPPIGNTYAFLEWYESLSASTVKSSDAPYEAYYKQLEDRRNECVALSDQVCLFLALHIQRANSKQDKCSIEP